MWLRSPRSRKVLVACCFVHKMDCLLPTFSKLHAILIHKQIEALWVHKLIKCQVTEDLQHLTNNDTSATMALARWRNKVNKEEDTREQNTRENNSKRAKCTRN